MCQIVTVSNSINAVETVQQRRHIFIYKIIISTPLTHSVLFIGQACTRMHTRERKSVLFGNNYKF